MKTLAEVLGLGTAITVAILAFIAGVGWALPRLAVYFQGLPDWVGPALGLWLVVMLLVGWGRYIYR